MHGVPKTFRGQDHHFIDEGTLSWSEESEEEDGDGEEEEYEDHRVDDEDWEIAERGAPPSLLSVRTCTHINFDRFHKTI